MISSKLLKPILLTSCVLSSLSVSASETKQVATIIDAVPLERTAPKYPLTAARKGREGWAKISFVVEKDGSVTNPVVEEIVGDKGFGKSALTAVKQWKYKPAIENGKPVQQCKKTVQMDFTMTKSADMEDDVTYLSPRFYRLYQSTIKAFNANNLELVKEKLAKLEDIKVWRVADAAFANLLKARYAGVSGDLKAQLNYLTKAAQIRKSFQPDVYLNILKQILAISIELNNIPSAYRNVSQIVKLEKDKKQLKKYKNYQEKLKNIIASDADIIVNGKIENNLAWNYYLLRRSFSLVQEQGNIHEVDVRCANKHHVFIVGEDSRWDIPATWKYCSLYISGKKGSTFKIVEHGNTKQQAKVTETTAAL